MKLLIATPTGTIKKYMVGLKSLKVSDRWESCKMVVKLLMCLFYSEHINTCWLFSYRLRKRMR